MRCVIEILSAGQSARRVWLQKGQAILVGRTEFADVCLPDDRCLSQQHFLIEQVEGGFRLRDLGSTNGTFLNGQQTMLSDLRQGDVIHAGFSEFKVAEISTDSSSSYVEPATDSALVIPPEFLEEEGNAVSAADAAPSSGPANPPPSAPAAAARPATGTSSDDATQEHAAFDAELTMRMDPKLAGGNPMQTIGMVPEARSGASSPRLLQKEKRRLLTVYRPPAEGVPPDELVRTLSEDREISLLLNITKVDQETAVLIQRLRARDQAYALSETISMVTAVEGLDLAEILKRNWGRDAAITIFSSLSPSVLVPILSSNIPFLCYPSIVVSAYRQGDARNILRRMRGLDAILVETGRDDNWLLMINRESAKGWDTASFPFEADMP